MYFKMNSIVFIVIYLYYFCNCNNDIEIKLDNTIEAVGFPYYKILMAIGDCKETLLYQDQKAWSKVRLNRIVDIYYRSGDPEMTVSRVEIELVLNDTDCFVVTRTGVGHSEFAGTLFIPTRAAIVLYQLYVFTCSRPRNKHHPNPIYDKARQSESALHKTTTVYYHPNMYFSSNEDDETIQNKMVAKEADYPRSPVDVPYRQ